MAINLESFSSYKVFVFVHNHSPLPMRGKLILSPYSLIHPTCIPGTPINKAKSFTFFVMTEPAPIKAFSPIVTPQIIVQFAPSVAPFFIRVVLYSSFLGMLI